MLEFMELVPGIFRSRLDGPNLRALELLEKGVATSEHFEHLGVGKVITRRGSVYVILDVLRTLILHLSRHHLSRRGPSHLVLGVGYSGQGIEISPESVCVEVRSEFPVCDSCFSFIMMVNSGWSPPINTITWAIRHMNVIAEGEREIRRAHERADGRRRRDEAKQKAALQHRLAKAVEDRNIGSLRSVIKEAESAGLDAGELTQAKTAFSEAAAMYVKENVAGLFEQAGGLAERAGDAERAQTAIQELRVQAIEDVLNEQPLTTTDLLLRAARSVSVLSACGIDVEDIDPVFVPLFERYDPTTIDNMILLWKVSGMGGGGDAEATVLERYRTN